MQFSRCLRVLTQAGTQPFRWLSCEVPPVPIPNTEVKLTYTDNTWLATAREDRQPPGPQRAPIARSEFFFVIMYFFQRTNERKLLYVAIFHMLKSMFPILHIHLRLFQRFLQFYPLHLLIPWILFSFCLKTL